MTGTAIKRIILRKIKEAEILIPPLGWNKVNSPRNRNPSFSLRQDGGDY